MSRIALGQDSERGLDIALPDVSGDLFDAERIVGRE
jgi:hypothetical protein